MKNTIKYTLAYFAGVLTIIGIVYIFRIHCCAMLLWLIFK